ncbi:MAG: threonine synthase [Oscillospiraceae bacterium]
MKYVSTREGKNGITASQAIVRGLAPDGGLYVPAELPKIDEAFVRELCAADYRTRVVKILGLFLEEFSEEELTAIAAASYAENFDHAAIAPMTYLDEETSVLELWHGPTSAFKDMALQIMPRLLTASLKKNGEERTVSILVATSGDTGKAALEGFRDVPGTRIMVFYPKDGVSQIQQLQMSTQEGENVNVVAVRGNFDDCQTGVKKIFGDTAFAETLNERGFFLSSANSINWGRLVPQVVYYFSAYCDLLNAGKIAYGDRVNFCVPTGNFGNILAGWIAKKMGLPVAKFICASNDNNVLTDFLNTGVYDRNRPFYLTGSPSMDILVSSNLERLLYCVTGDAALVAENMNKLSEEGRYAVDASVLDIIRADFVGGFCRDEQSREEIARRWKDGYLMDPHTAVASRVLEDYRAGTGDRTPCVIVSTASPFKFGGTVLDALGGVTGESGPALMEELTAFTGVSAPKPLAALAGKPVRFEDWVEIPDMEEAVAAFLR